MTTTINISDEAREAACQEILKSNEPVALGHFVQTLLNSRDAEIQSLRRENLKLSQEAGFLNGVIQGVLHWDIPVELKVKLQGALLKDAAMSGKEGK